MRTAVGAGATSSAGAGARTTAVRTSATTSGRIVIGLEVPRQVQVLGIVQVVQNVTPAGCGDRRPRARH